MARYESNYDGQPRGSVSFSQAISICFNKYATFSGRASVAEYWWWILFQWLVSCGATVISDWLGSVAGLVLLLPTLAVSWRRMHDIGKGGGWFFINFIPLVGWIIWIVWCCRSSEPYPNRFGPEP